MGNNKTILKSIAKAIRWRRRMEAEANCTLSRIADEEGVSVRYVRKVYKLNYLMPDIIAALLNNKNPNSLTIEDFQKNIPISWKDQYEWFFEND